MFAESRLAKRMPLLIYMLFSSKKHVFTGIPDCRCPEVNICCTTSNIRLS